MGTCVLIVLECVCSAFLAQSQLNISARGTCVRMPQYKTERKIEILKYAYARIHVFMYSNLLRAKGIMYACRIYCQMC
jgi:hypothetical protein